MSKFKIELRTFASSGEPIVREDGTVEVVPMQLFRLRKGDVVLRIGRSIYVFDEHGRYDGSEHKGAALVPEQRDRLLQALQTDNRGKAPAETYYQPGTKGWRAEVESAAADSTTYGRAQLYEAEPEDSDSN